jgi:hypothetical protein
MSRPEIAIHKTSLWKTQIVKRSQRDYSMSLKLQIVSEIGCGLSITSQKNMAYKLDPQWFNGYENLVALIGKTKHPYVKVTRTKDYGLEAKVKLLEKQKSFLEQQAYVADKKAIILI